MTDLLHVIGVVVAAPSAMCLLMGSRDQNVWYTLGFGLFLALMTYGG